MPQRRIERSTRSSRTMLTLRSFKRPSKNAVQPFELTIECPTLDEEDQTRSTKSSTDHETEVPSLTSSATGSDSTDSGVSVEFMGKNITLKKGLYAYKLSIMFLPLMPVVLLIILTGFEFGPLFSKAKLVSDLDSQLKGTSALSNLAAELQDERYHTIFVMLWSKNITKSNYSFTELYEESVAKTDLAIARLDPWRDSIPLKVFASKVRFQIRLDDMRKKAIVEKAASFEEVLNFFNTAVDAILNQFVAEIQYSNETNIWRGFIIYKNILRALDNIGKNAGFVIKYFYRGSLSDSDMVKYLKSQVLAIEYMNQAANFSRLIRKLWKIVQDGSNYKLLEEIWEDVEDETKSIDYTNSTEVEIWIGKLSQASMQYIEDLRKIQLQQFLLLQAYTEEGVYNSKVYTYKTFGLIAFVLVVAPLIIVLNYRMASAAEGFIVALARRGKKILKEQRNSEKLVTKLLPPVVATELKESKKSSYTFDAVTVAFCYLYGFSYLIQFWDPMDLFTILNNIYKVFDDQISYFDAYKVETINDKYMVASGIPKENGNRHADEIARLALTLRNTIQGMRDQSTKFPKIHARIGIHSGNTVAGVVGSKMPRFCLFGDTINLASRMETSGEPGKIHISSTTKALLELTEADNYIVESRGNTEIKGKGLQETFWLIGRKDRLFKKLASRSIKVNQAFASAPELENVE